MERISGREAITAMAEMDLGVREFTDEEKQYIWKRALSFREWLVAECKKSLLEARDICTRCYDRDIELLLQTDPYADFIWSRRNDEAGDMEIDILTAIDNDPEARTEAEFKQFHSYWRDMETTAEQNVGKYPDEIWKASRLKFHEIMEYLAAINELPANDSKRKTLLARSWQRLVELRRGRQPILMWRHFAVCRNIIDEMRGIKRPKLIVTCPQDEDQKDYHDAMDLVVHGLEVESLEDVDEEVTTC